jgi:hypothetical protein
LRLFIPWRLRAGRSAIGERTELVAASGGEDAADWLVGWSAKVACGEVATYLCCLSSKGEAASIGSSGFGMGITGSVGLSF